MNRIHLSRRNLLKRFGIGLAAAPMLQRSQRASAAAAPAAAGPRIAGAPRSPHAVGDPRGSDIAVAAGRTKEGRFGVMFKSLPAFAPPDDLLVSLAADMVDPRPPLDDVKNSNDGFDNFNIPAGFIYVGQFTDHDMTRDTTPLGLQAQDPHALTNYDTPLFDLGSVYGRGPTADPRLYDPANPGALLLASPNGVPDLPRQADGTAIIGDPRNDENLIVCQLQIAFLRLHNAFLGEGMTFAQAQQQTRWHFQWIIVHDFLPHVVGQDVVDSLLVQTGSGPIRVKPKFYKPKNPNRPMMPIEYAVGAYRFGHSMIRPEYEIHENLTLPIFSDQGPDLRGSRPLPADLAIDWNYFFEIPSTDPPDDRNFARMIDTKLSLPLANLPPTVVAHDPGAILALAARNLLRGKRLGLPAGQDVAKAMGVAPLGNSDLGLTDPRWGGKAPLWFYILKEAELVQQGARLGPVGGRIVAEVILGILGLRQNSYFNAKARFAPITPDFRMGDLLVHAGAVVPGQAKPPEGAVDPAKPGDVVGAPEVPKPEVVKPGDVPGTTGATA
jgi:Animal haem peroxidase